MPVNFPRLDPLEDRLIDAIAGRMRQIALDYKRKFQRMDLGDIDGLQLAMDIKNVHCNGRPLRLFAMLHGDATQFQHDMMQIHLHVNRVDGGIALAVPLYFATNGEHPGGGTNENGSSLILLN